MSRDGLGWTTSVQFPTRAGISVICITFRPKLGPTHRRLFPLGYDRSSVKLTTHLPLVKGKGGDEWSASRPARLTPKSLWYPLDRRLGGPPCRHLHLVPRSKNAWSYASTHQYVFMARCLVKRRENFTFSDLSQTRDLK
jgi:hypothetical protein